MNKNSVTAGLIIVFAFCVMGTSVLSYYYVLSVRRLGRVHAEWFEVQQLQTRVNYFSRDALRYSLSHPEIIPILDSFEIRLRTIDRTNVVTDPNLGVE